VELDWRIQDMPELGSNDACYDSEGHHAHCVGFDARAAKAAVHDEACGHGGQPQHQPKGRHVKMPEVQIGNHRFSSIDGHAIEGAPALSERVMGGVFHRGACIPTPDTGDTKCMDTVHYKALEVLYTRQQIAERVAEMGAQITRDLSGEKLVMVGVLKGAAPFLADLARAVQVDATFDFVATSSYGKGMRSSGAVKLIKDLDEPIEGKNVLLVEDILDTGLTLSYLRKLFVQQRPKTLRIATLLDKPSRRIEKIEADYIGFSIPNLFVIGYGMDYAERYRNLPDICLMTPDHPE